MNYNLLETTTCDKVKYLTQAIKEALYSEASSYTCIKDGNNNFNLTSNLKTKAISTVILQIRRCVNSTKNDNICRPQSEIDKFLLNADFSMLVVTPSFTVDHFNINDPIRLSLREETFKMHTGMFVSRQTFMRTVIYIDDRGLVTENPSTYHLYDKDIYRSTTDFQIKSQDPGLLYQHSVFILGESVDTYKRSFARLQSLIANIGGVVSSLMTFSGFCARFISSQMFTIFIGNYFADLSHGLSPSPLNKEYAINKTLQNSISLKKPEHYPKFFYKMRSEIFWVWTKKFGRRKRRNFC